MSADIEKRRWLDYHCNTRGRGVYKPEIFTKYFWLKWIFIVFIFDYQSMEEISRLSALLGKQLDAMEDTIARLTAAMNEFSKQQNPHKRPRTCRGCQEDQPNQMAHYGGCIPDPNE